MFSDHLNPKQCEAVKSTEGPVLILAGPGSGKTRVLIWRIAHLIKQGIPPRNILTVTFTNKAAQEIKNRLYALLSREMGLPAYAKASADKPASYYCGVTAGTFHAICAQILRSELPRPQSEKLPLPVNGERAGVRGNLNSNFTIYDEEDCRSLVKKILKELELPEDYFKPAAVLNNISRAKNDLQGVIEYEAQAFDYYPQTIGKIYHRYQKALREANAADFDDLLMLTAKIFTDHPAILAKYQERFKYIMVDEYQDTNRAQYIIINLLAKKYQNICVVGDEAQSIYGWRGADISNILNFQKDYPKAKPILLEQNYRSTQNILDAAQAIICQNTSCLEKNLWTESAIGDPLKIYQAENEKDEGAFVAREILALKTRLNLKFNDFAVLYRNNAQSRYIEEAFLRADLPYRIVGGLKFYQRKEIKDILAYLRFIQNPEDFVSLERIINIPPRGIGSKTVLSSLIFPRPACGERVGVRGEVFPKVKTFFQMIDELRLTPQEITLTNFLDALLKKINYKQYILDKTKEGESRWENIQELFTVLRDYDDLPWSDGLNKFLEQTALVSDADGINFNYETVNLMTLHSSKGLEFPVVFITGCEESIFPSSKSYLNFAELEEERRLCYVGITRAKKMVYLTYACQRMLYGSICANLPSRFIDEIPRHLIKRILI